MNIRLIHTSAYQEKYETDEYKKYIGWCSDTTYKETIFVINKKGKMVLVEMMFYYKENFGFLFHYRTLDNIEIYPEYVVLNTVEFV